MLVVGATRLKLLVTLGLTCKVLVVGATRPKLSVVAARSDLSIRTTTTCAAFVHVVIVWLLHLS